MVNKINHRRGDEKLQKLNLKTRAITTPSVIGVSIMSNLKKITNQNLDENLKALVVSEREILSEIILHIVEVERRKLYLTFGFPSLFEYLTKSVGYANGSAQRRIDAARLSFDVPDVIHKLESGEINLSQVSLIQKSIRDIQSTKNTKIQAKIKEKLLNDLANKSFLESEVIVNQILDIKLKESPTIKYQKDESVRFEVTFSKDQWAKLLRMRELLSHSLPSGSWDQVLEYVSDKVIAQNDKSRLSIKEKGPSSNVTPAEGSRKNETLLSPQSSTKTRHYIPAETQRLVFRRDQCCQYRDKHSGNMCKSKWRLTLDHIQPVWADGDNSAENLRVLCANHNRQLYREQASLTVR